MDDVKKEGTPESSADVQPEKGVSDQEDQSQEGSQTSEETDSQSQSQSQETDTIDEHGVPWKNRAAEWKRKHEEVAESLPNIVQQAVSEAIQKSQPAAPQPEYTIEQIEQLKIQYPQYAPQLEAKKSELMLKQISKQLDEKVQGMESKQQEQIVRQQSDAYVAQNFPEMFHKDSFGRLQWNYNHPLTQELSKVMTDPRFQKDPEGMKLAVEVANSRYLRSKLSKTEGANKDLKGQLRKAEAKTLTEGSGQNSPSQTPAVRKAVDALKKSGSKQAVEGAAKVAVSEFLKASGLLKE